MEVKTIARATLFNALLVTSSAVAAGALSEMSFDTFVNNDPTRCRLMLKYLEVNQVHRFDAKELCAFRARGYGGGASSGVTHLDWSRIDGVDSLVLARQMYEANHSQTQLKSKTSQEKEFLQFVSNLSGRNELLIRSARLDVDGRIYSVTTINSNHCGGAVGGWWSLPQASLRDSGGNAVALQFSVPGQPIYVDGQAALLAISDEDWQPAKYGKRPFIYGTLSQIDIGLVAGRLQATPNTVCSFNIYKDM